MSRRCFLRFLTTEALSRVDGGARADTRSVGSGAVYSFDPVGSYEREACRAAGAAQSLVQPFLDNQVSAGILVALLLSSTSAQLQLQLCPLRMGGDTPSLPMIASSRNES